MHLMSRGGATHSQKLETWLGKEVVERVSNQMKNFYWPVALHGVPGNVYCMPGGDFAGEIDGGQFGSAFDKANDALRRFQAEQRAKVARHRIGNDLVLQQRLDRRLHAFSSLSALINAATTGGKKQDMGPFLKTGANTNFAGQGTDLWIRNGLPAAGAAGAAAPNGTAPTSSTQGALFYRNGVSANSNRFVGGWATASVVNNSLLLYDRLFMVAKTMNSTAAESVTGTQSRYASTNPNDFDYAGGNFITLSATVTLSSTAHSVTAADTAVWRYTNQSGTALRELNHNGTTIQTLTGVSGCVASGINLPANYWFIPLATGDVGIAQLTQMQLSAAVTGGLNAVIGHPIAVFPCPVANLVCQVDGINTAFNLTPIMDNACLAVLELPKPSTAATTYNFQIYVVSE